MRVYGALSSEMFDAVIQSAFSESADGSPEFILNQDSGFVHFAGCNHLPPEELRQQILKADLDSGKYRKCSLCFLNLPRVAGLRVEMHLGGVQAGTIQARYPLATDDHLNIRVRNIGAKVLEHWVAPLRGYQYKFHVVESGETNAWACSGGRIYISTSLLAGIESDEELEALLAHEIAHVEMRHGYRQFRSQQKAAAWVALGLVIAGAATKSREVVEIANLIGQTALTIVLRGHSREHEAEADAFANIYFETNEVPDGKAALISLLKKLEYDQDFHDPEHSGGGLFATHPQVQDRIDAAEKSTVSVFAPPIAFYGYSRDGALVASINFLSQRYYSGTENPDEVGLRLLALIETTSALGGKGQVRDIEIFSQGGRLKLDNKEDTAVFPNDAVGATFVSAGRHELVHGIDGIKFDLKNVVDWRRSDPESLQLFKDFSFNVPVQLSRLPTEVREGWIQCQATRDPSSQAIGRGAQHFAVEPDTDFSETITVKFNASFGESLEDAKVYRCEVFLGEGSSSPRPTKPSPKASQVWARVSEESILKVSGEIPAEVRSVGERSEKPTITTGPVQIVGQAAPNP